MCCVLCYVYIIIIELGGQVLVHFEFNLSFILNYLPRNDPRLLKRMSGNSRQVQEWLGMPKHNWQSHILSGSLIHFLGGYLHAKIKEIYPLLSEILMIKESCKFDCPRTFWSTTSQSQETEIFTENFVILKFTTRPKTPRIIFKKHGLLRKESTTCS